jgi:hypothetical protein
VYTGFWWKSLREGDHLEDSGVDKRIILKWVFEKWGGSLDWMELDQDRYRWRALVKRVMDIRVL